MFNLITNLNIYFTKIRSIEVHSNITRLITKLQNVGILPTRHKYLRGHKETSERSIYSRQLKVDLLRKSWW